MLSKFTIIILLKVARVHVVLTIVSEKDSQEIFDLNPKLSYKFRIKF